MIRPSHTILGRSLKAAMERQGELLKEKLDLDRQIAAVNTRIAEFDAEITDITDAMATIGENI